MLQQINMNKICTRLVQTYRLLYFQDHWSNEFSSDVRFNRLHGVLVSVLNCYSSWHAFKSRDITEILLRTIPLFHNENTNGI